MVEPSLGGFDTPKLFGVIFIRMSRNVFKILKRALVLTACPKYCLCMYTNIF